MLDPGNLQEKEAYTIHGPPPADTIRPGMEREAKEQSKALEEHYAHPLVYGTLHAQGYEHETNGMSAMPWRWRRWATPTRTLERGIKPGNQLRLKQLPCFSNQ
jgi:hypothetical protein